MGDGMEYWIPLAIGSALLLALGNIAMRIELVSNENFWAILGGMMFWGIITLLPFSFVELQSSSISITAEEIFFYFMVGLFQFFLARVVYFKAVQLGGASVASASSAASEPILTAILAVSLIREDITLYVVAGAVIAAISVAILYLDKESSKLISYPVLLGMMSGTLASLATVILRFTFISQMNLPPVIGVLFAYLISFVLILAVVGVKELMNILRKRILFVSGFLLAMAHVLRFDALKYGSATEVTVLVLSYPIFVTLIASVVNKTKESITYYRVLAALGVVVANILVVLGG